MNVTVYLSAHLFFWLKLWEAQGFFLHVFRPTLERKISYFWVYAFLNWVFAFLNWVFRKIWRKIAEKSKIWAKNVKKSVKNEILFLKISYFRVFAFLNWVLGLFGKKKAWSLASLTIFLHAEKRDWISRVWFNATSNNELRK